MAINYAPKGPICKIVSPAPSAEPSSQIQVPAPVENVDIEEKKPKYDRNAAHKSYMKNYMRAYMREWRKRNPKKKSDGRPSGTST
jgi:hypothetical protein